MNSIYAYVDKKTDKIIYVGLDSYIDKQKRHKGHLLKSSYNQQPINRVLQNNPDRYEYKVLKQGNFQYDLLNILEILYIRRYRPKFNFTSGGDGFKGFIRSEKTRRKMSEVKTGKNNPSYGVVPSDKTRKLISGVKSSTGFFRVYKQKYNNKQGFLWKYQYYFEKGKRKSISSVDFKTLEDKVKSQGLDWFIVDEDKANATLMEAGL